MESNPYVCMQRAMVSFTSAANSLSGLMLPFDLSSQQAEEAMVNLNLITSLINLWVGFNGDVSVFKKIREGLKLVRL